MPPRLIGWMKDKILWRGRLVAFDITVWRYGALGAQDRGPANDVGIEVLPFLRLVLLHAIPNGNAIS